MIEVYPNLFLGNEMDYELHKNELTEGWKILQAAKTPYHKEAVGYTCRRCPEENPEYLVAVRGNRMILNMVDAVDLNRIPLKLIISGVDFIKDSLDSGNKILVHCNKGKSRAPMLVLLYLHLYTDLLPKPFGEAEKKFSEIYPDYRPAVGVRSAVCMLWNILDDS